MPEVEREAHHFPYLELILGTAVISSLFAFSRPVRREMRERDQVDVWDGSSGILEAAHIDHDRSNPNYNSLSNGRMLSRRNHYLDHYNRVGRNGLTLAGNNYALNKIWERLSEEEREGLPLPPTT